jgi:peptide/nickel transport system substrate-binding protein
VFGVSLVEAGYGIVKNNFHNVPAMISAARYPNPGPANPEQFFIAD